MSTGGDAGSDVVDAGSGDGKVGGAEVATGVDWVSTVADGVDGADGNETGSGGVNVASSAAVGRLPPPSISSFF